MDRQPSPMTGPACLIYLSDTFSLLSDNPANDNVYFLNKYPRIAFDVIDYVLLKFVDVAAKLGAVGDVDCDNQAVAFGFVADNYFFYPDFAVFFRDAVDHHLAERRFGDCHLAAF